MEAGKLIRCLFYLLLLLLPGWQSFADSQAALKNLQLEYAKADALYRKAIALGYSADYSEEKEKQLNQEALQGFRQLMQDLPAQNGLYDTIRFFSFFKAGELEHYFDEPERAKLNYQKALELRGKIALADSFFFRPNLYAGIISYQKMQLDAALQYLRSADQIQDSYTVKLEEAERLYNNLGVLHYESGNLAQAKNYFEKAASVLQPSHPYYRNLFVNYQVNIAGIEIKLKNYAAARKIYAQVLPYQLHTQEIRHHLGLSYLEAADPQQALHFFRQVQYHHRLDVGLNNDKARAHLQLQSLDSAAFYLAQAEAANKKYHQHLPNTDYGLTLKYRGDRELQLKNPNMALAFYQSALHQIYPSFRSAAPEDNPKEFSGILSYAPLFHTLVAKATAWEALYQSSRNNAALKAATDAYTAAFDLSDYIAALYDNDEARLFLSQVKYVIHSKPVSAAVALYQKTGEADYASLAYLFDQRTKASALAYRQQEAKRKVPEKEQHLKNEISRLSVIAGRSSDSTERARLHGEIREAAIALGKLQDRLPAAQQGILKNIPSVRDLQQKLLDDHSAILSFNLSPDQLTRFAITKNRFEIQQKNLPAGFREKMHDLFVALRNFEMPDQHFLKALHQLLVPEEEPGIRRWIIVPDELLHYLPFEILVNKNGSYLVTEQAVQYQYATALLQKQDVDLSGAQTLGLAPFAGNPRAEKQKLLPYSATEVQRLQGKVLRDTMASKKAFLQHIKGYGILHLATHAHLDEARPELSYIDFSPSAGQSPGNSQLFLTEINNLPLQQTQLVILSACATSGGNLVQGEGVMSISRAFAFAGCPNVVTTLWKAEDAATAYLTQKLHAYLKQNKPLDIALQLSKLDYLRDKNINPRLKNPAFWAHLVLIGDYEPAKKDLVIWWISAFSAAAFFLLSVFIIRRQKKSK